MKINFLLTAQIIICVLVVFFLGKICPDVYFFWIITFMLSAATFVYGMYFFKKTYIKTWAKSSKEGKDRIAILLFVLVTLSVIFYFVYEKSLGEFTFKDKYEFYVIIFLLTTGFPFFMAWMRKRRFNAED